MENRARVTPVKMPRTAPERPPSTTVSRDFQKGNAAFLIGLPFQDVEGDRSPGHWNQVDGPQNEILPPENLLPDEEIGKIGIGTDQGQGPQQDWQPSGKPVTGQREEEQDTGGRNWSPVEEQEGNVLPGQPGRFGQIG